MESENTVSSSTKGCNKIDNAQIPEGSLRIDNDAMNVFSSNATDYVHFQMFLFALKKLRALLKI